MSEIKVEVNGENFTPIGVSGSSTMMANLASALRLAAALVLVIEKLAEARRAELGAVVERAKAECAGVAAAWCPICGDCACSRNRDVGSCCHDNPDCPLHGEASGHGEPDDSPVCAETVSQFAERMARKFEGWAAKSEEYKIDGRALALNDVCAVLRAEAAK